jgi:hypothetical protein
VCNNVKGHFGLYLITPHEKYARPNQEGRKRPFNEQMHTEVASVVGTVEEANIMLESYKDSFDGVLIKFNEGSLS